MADHLKTADFYQENKKLGDEAYWKGYLDASEDHLWDFWKATSSSTSVARDRNVRRLLNQREKFLRSCEDVIRSEYDCSLAKNKVVQTKTIEYNFE